MGGRRKGREQALQVLCILDAQPELAPEAALKLYFSHLRGPSTEDEGEEDAAEREAERPFTEQLVLGVRREREALDELISKSSRNWRIERMNFVDRNLLRLAAFELRSVKETPARVAINEAIEVAKRFGANESPAFVNGVLDRLMADLGRR
jgi:transcription antitermination protein NusB